MSFRDLLVVLFVLVLLSLFFPGYVPRQYSGGASVVLFILLLVVLLR